MEAGAIATNGALTEVSEEPELREITGPAALGGGRKRFLELLLLMSVTDFKKTYFGTMLGYLWSLLRPLLLFGVLLVVFTKILRVGSTIPNYSMFLLLNIVLFGFFQESTMNATSSVVSREGIVRKTQFPRLVIPFSATATGLFNLLVNLIAVFGFMLASGLYPRLSWFMLIPVILALTALTAGMSMLLSALYVRRRDTLIIWSVMSMALFYGSAVLIPVEFAGETLQKIMFINPIVPILVQTRVWMIDPNAPTAVELAGGWAHLIPAAVVFVVVCALGWWYFNREAPRVAEEL